MKMTKKCPCEGQDVIVITIECCNKKTCEHLKKRRKDEGDDGGPDEIPGGPGVPGVPGDSGDQDKADDDDGPSKRTSSNANEDNEDNNGETDLPKDSKPTIEKTDDYNNNNDDDDEQQIFSLPVLPERYHGTGCAMEVSIMEKHDNKCMYKKMANNKRNSLEDRVGSYECVGRLIFRTCNHPNDTTVSQTALGPTTSSQNNKLARQAASTQLPGGRSSLSTGKGGPSKNNTPGPSSTNNKNKNKADVNETILNFLVQPHMHEYGTFDKEHLKRQMEKLQNTLLDRASIKALATVSKTFPANEKSSLTSLTSAKTSLNVLAPKDSLDTIITLTSENDEKLVQYGVPGVFNKFLSLFKKNKRTRSKNKSNV